MRGTRSSRTIAADSEPSSPNRPAATSPSGIALAPTAMLSMHTRTSAAAHRGSPASRGSVRRSPSAMEVLVIDDIP